MLPRSCSHRGRRDPSFPEGSGLIGLQRWHLAPPPGYGETHILHFSAAEGRATRVGCQEPADYISRESATVPKNPLRLVPIVVTATMIAIGDQSRDQAVLDCCDPVFIPDESDQALHLFSLLPAVMDFPL